MTRRQLFVTITAVGLAFGLFGAPALAQPAGVQMIGTVEGFADSMVTLTSGDAFPVADPVNVTELRRVTAADLSPGQYVAIASSRDADGVLTASFLSAFPEAARGRGEGQRQMAEIGFCAPLCQLGDLMTNANIDEAVLDAVEGGQLTVTFSGESAQVRVTPDTRISIQSAGSASDLIPGADIIGFVNAQGVAGTVWVYVS